MFELKNKQLYITELFDISDNYCSLINDGAVDLLYRGTNKFGSNILGSILFEDDENLYLRYIHSIVSDETLNDFLNKRISLRSIIYDSNSVFIVDKGYNNDIKDSALIPLEDLPSDYLPLEKSYCPSFVKRNTFEYTFSLKGGLADTHKAEPLIMSDTNSKIYKLLNSATTFLNELDIVPKIYSEVALAGSFQLNFEISLNEKPSLFSKSSNDIKTFFSEFLNYIFDKLPEESQDVLKNEEKSSKELKLLFGEIKNIYNSRNVVLNDETFEQKIIDLITYSVDSIKDIEYKGYNKIEISNRLQNGEILPIALIKTDYYETVVNKIFKPEQEEKLDEIVFDENPKDYKIQVYSLNNESGNGGAYFVVDDNVSKISLHLKGKTDYHGTVYTKSLDDKNSIDIQGIGKWINGVLKEITVNL
ncbi:MAG: hypothetical protein H7239_04395 [Flavobacterium sp.]|nr:hypothetical protein [Flavobacterium sp.]